MPTDKRPSVQPTPTQPGGRESNKNRLGDVFFLAKLPRNLSSRDAFAFLFLLCRLLFLPSNWFGLGKRAFVVVVVST